MEEATPRTIERSDHFRFKSPPMLDRTLSDPTQHHNTKGLSVPASQTRAVSPSIRSYLGTQLQDFREGEHHVKYPEEEPLHIQNPLNPSQQKSFQSMRGTVISIPLSLSDSGSETEAKYDSKMGERDRIRELEDPAHWISDVPSRVISPDLTEQLNDHPEEFILKRQFQETNYDDENSSFTKHHKRSSTFSTVGDEVTSESVYGSSTTPCGVPKLGQDSRENLTSYPLTTVLRKDLEDGILRLLDISQFENFLMNTEARNIFREWLIERNKTDENSGSGNDPDPLPSNVIRLDQFVDETIACELSNKLRLHSEALLDIYYRDEKNVKSTARPKALNKKSFMDASALASTRNKFGPSRSWLLQSLYDQDFKLFITTKLVDLVKLKLGSGLAEEDYSGLGDSFVLSNPRFRDNPVVIVSPGFAAVTGYDSKSIIGRNCRFLQGPRTNPNSIERLRRSLRAGEPCVELLLNYRSDGTPFQCLLTILPLFDQKGGLNYYIGGQVNVTGGIKAFGDLATFVKTPVDPSQSDIQTSIISNPSATMIKHVHNSSSPEATQNLSRSVGSETVTLGRNQSRSQFRDSNSSNYTGKHSKLSWLTSIVKREKEVVDLEFNGFSKDATPCETLEKNISSFQSAYSRLLLFRKNSRTIVFVTSEALEFLGLPTETHHDTYSSALLHTDFFDLIDMSTHKKTKNLKNSLKKVIQDNLAASVKCRLAWSLIPPPDHHGALARTKKATVARDCVVHLSPLVDCSSTCTSYIAVIG
ncbi:PAS domain-containing protein [Melampsora americana]|nr:PAS domain-containing protein [Melampsora americana]